jgi:hypothetical protein
MNHTFHQSPSSIHQRAPQNPFWGQGSSRTTAISPEFAGAGVANRMIDVSAAIESDGGLQRNLRSDVVRIKSRLILFERSVLASQSNG